MGALVGSTVFLVIAPGFVAGLAPYWLSGWRIGPALLGMVWVRWIGGAMILLGVAALLDSFARFALQGLGTPAPPFPTTRLVVTGAYRYVRNPMYVAVVSAIVGQGLLLGSLPLLGYAAAVWFGFHLFVVSYEEPILKARFGPEYADYCTGVRRWSPRLRPWRSSSR